MIIFRILYSPPLKAAREGGFCIGDRTAQECKFAAVAAASLLTNIF